VAVRRKTESTTLAFLDIISCGLGAVILIFLIIKHNVDLGSEQTDDLAAQMATLEQQKEILTEQSQDARQQNSDTAQAGKSLEDQLVDAKGKLVSLRRQNISKEEQNKIAKGKVDEIEVAVPVETIELKGEGQANYIIGLQVKGARIAILIDHSASMTYPTLEQAILSKFDTDAQRRAAPKWQRTLRIAKWLMTHIPTQSKFAFIGFNDKARLLSQGKSWSSAVNQGELTNTVQIISGLTPTGGTNLEAGMRLAMNLNPRPTNIYIVTDSLPTQGSASCAKKRSVTPKCRAALLSNISKYLRSTFPRQRVPINTILLPMTGDPEALPRFWGWANATKGIVMSPSEKWP
jgi:von Willebrand factor type A domain